jgi:hypothetical protein
MGMFIFFLVLIGAGAIGGFGIGQLTGEAFSILGAGGIAFGVFVVFMGFGAYFDAEEQKRKKKARLSPEIEGVFDRMITGSSNPTRKEVEQAKRKFRR